MSNHLPHWIPFDKKEFDENITINILEIAETLNFDVKRVYTIQSGNKPATRGGHAHRNQCQVIYLLSGGCTIRLYSIDKTLQKYELKNNANALYIPENYWIELDVTENTTLLCMASLPYNELISIFDKASFFNQ